MEKNRLHTKIKWCCCFLAVLLPLAGRALTKTAAQTPQFTVKARLAFQVKDFDNQSKPLIPTLLRLAVDYHLPIGIEKVDKAGLDQPITVKLQQGTVARALELCISQVPGYAWTVQDGVVLVYGIRELKNPSNLLNYVIPDFAVTNETLDNANMNLRKILSLASETPGGTYVGSYIGTPQLRTKRISLTVRNATVRHILNRLTALHGEVVWLAQVPPEELSHTPTPSAGLWRFFLRDGQDLEEKYGLKH
jgi:hypothetical protein